MLKARTFVTVAMLCASQTVWCVEQKEGLLEMLLRRSGIDPESLGAAADGQAERDAETESRALRLREAFRSMSGDELLERAAEGVGSARAAARELDPPSVAANATQLRNALAWADRTHRRSQELRAILSELLRRKLRSAKPANAKRTLDPDDPVDALMLALLRRGAAQPEPKELGGRHLTNSIGMEFVHIPAGNLMMGSEEGGSDEKPAHQVTITQPFYMGKYEVTQAQFKQIMGRNPSRFDDPDHPVDKATWYQAYEFCQKLTRKEGRLYRLPTEAQWEYACRAGTKTRYSFGDDESDLGKYAWFKGNSGKRAHAVGEKLPNPWGLYDMHGNVWEWCRDGKRKYCGAKMFDPVGPRDSSRVLRGGAWDDGPKGLRSAARAGIGSVFGRNPRGFRVVLLLSSR